MNNSLSLKVFDIHTYMSFYSHLNICKLYDYLLNYVNYVNYRKSLNLDTISVKNGIWNLIGVDLE